MNDFLLQQKSARCVLCCRIVMTLDEVVANSRNYKIVLRAILKVKYLTIFQLLLMSLGDVIDVINGVINKIVLLSLRTFFFFFFGGGKGDRE